MPLSFMPVTMKALITAYRSSFERLSKVLDCDGFRSRLD